MEKLNFPHYKVLLKNKENKPYIFDRIRKKWLQHTPEEWVRVHSVQYLIETKAYPASWILIEKEIKLFQTRKRIDIAVVNPHNNENQILVECKAPSVPIDQKTFDQITRYNLALQCQYLMVSNGLNHYFCEMNFEENQLIFIETLPDYSFTI